jgi:transcriptional regulator of acetoin/glycerol metabolism
MPFNMQAKLLRVLEDKKIYPLGGGAGVVWMSIPELWRLQIKI